LGLFYESFTDLLGFERNSDEWKVMGLAAYGQPTVDLRRYGVVTTDGYRVNGRLLSGLRRRQLHYLTQEMGARRDPEAELTDRERDIAASVQMFTEEALMAVVRDAVRRTGCRRLCLAGGVAMNSKANGRLLASGIVDEVFVQPAATDDGTAVGAGFAALLPLGHSIGRAQLTDVYLGPELTDEEIVHTLDTCKVPYTVSEGAPEIAARLIADGNVVAWVQGRMEFGPRALGNRSILGDPRDASTRDRINESVKYREPWRPFAPSCLSETMGEYFTPAATSPFMILCFDVLSDRRPVIPAVVHADNTSRVQTVDRNQNPPYRRLIEEFARLTGVPVVVNTSFNLRGEPIVCTPRDALRTFWSSGMDYLVMGSCMVAKSPEGMEQIRRLAAGEPAAVT
jgi:carbamoyltransferase